jgi:hypothetical protein
MPAPDGIQATRQIMAERAGFVPRLLILTTFDLAYESGLVTTA